MVRVRVSRAGGLKMAYRALEATEGGRLTDVEKRVYFLSFAQVSSPFRAQGLELPFSSPLSFRLGHVCLACVAPFFCRTLAWLLER